MTPDDKKEFVRVLTGLAAIKRVDMTREAFEMWWAAMQDWSIADFRDAAGYLLNTCEFMPTPYDFAELKKLSRPSAHEAWAQALSFCMGAWRRSASCGDKRIDAAIATIGGYQTVALCDTDKLGFYERRFIETYNNFVESDDARQALPDLTERTTVRIGGPKTVGALLESLTEGADHD